MSNTSPRSVSSIFALATKTFGVGNSNKQPKSAQKENSKVVKKRRSLGALTTPIRPAAKRKSINNGAENLDESSMPSKRRSIDQMISQKEPLLDLNHNESITLIDVSTDKRELLPYLSCQADDFELGEETLPILNEEEKTVEPPSRIERDYRNKDDVNTPDIGEFSDTEDPFMSQICAVNHGLSVLLQKKPRYRPTNKVPKPGGLMEKFYVMKRKRQKAALAYLKGKESTPGQRRINIEDSHLFRKRLVLLFRFLDCSSDENELSVHRFLIAPPDFERLLRKQKIFEVVFDLPELQLKKNLFLHFAKMIKAGQVVTDK